VKGFKDRIEMLSVMIPCQEDDVLLFPTLKSIFSNHFRPQDFEVLLICGDDVLISKGKVNEFPVQVHSGSFRGQAQALNWGLERTSGDIICTTKPGCVVASDWLSEIARFLQRCPSVDGVGGPVLPCWEYGTKLQKLASQIFSEEQGFPTSVVVPKLGSYQGLFHATNSAFRKEVLTSVKFDESLIYGYDFDACWKMLRKGNRLVYNPEMKVRYVFPFGIQSILRRYYVWGKEKVIVRRKHFLRTGFKEFLYIPYSTVRSLLQPSTLASKKKLLTFLQHLAFDVGCTRGYGVHQFQNLA
jgi:cellulose synthase/poly-beta-1,6-N-acetylglucosamine synthase-like glycosyltransferase